jgi:hypothetical protein
MSRGFANPNGNGGGSKASPINFFLSQSDESLTQKLSGSKFDSRQSRQKSYKSRVLQCDEQLATLRLLFLAEFLESGIGGKNLLHATSCGRGRNRLQSNWGSLVSVGWLVRFWRDGGDDFFEARLAAQRIPERHQF